MLIHKYSQTLAAVVLAAPLAAQVTISSGARCSSWPGSAFGVIAYQCANCGFKAETSQRTAYTFFAEPVITEVDRNSTLVAGDVIEAVDDHPITTQAGAEAFTYPGTGMHSLTVRRGRDRQTIQVSLPQRCLTTVSGSSTINGTPVAGDKPKQVTIEPLFVVDGVVQPSRAPTAPEMGRFGFAVECRPSCSLKRATNGEYYYKYEGFPRITELRDKSAAERSGLRVGDLIIKVDGKSILDEGVLQNLEGRDQLHLTVRRDGKDIDVMMLVTR